MEKSQALPKLLSRQCETMGFNFLDAGQYIESSLFDGVHIDSSGHRVLANQLWQKITQDYPAYFQLEENIEFTNSVSS